MAGDISVGSIVGYLRLDRAAWSAEIDKAKEQAKDLSRVDPRVKITTDAPKAIAELEAVAAAAKRLQDAQGRVSVAQGKVNALQLSTGGVATPEASRKLAAAQEVLNRATRDVELSQIRLASAYETVDADQQKVAKSAKDLNDHGFGPLVTSILTIGPALLPIAAVASAALGGLALGLGSAVVGVLGVKKEMQAGTDVGQQYSAGLQTLKADFGQLESTGAGALLGSFNQAVQLSNRLLPTLNSEVGQFSSITGDAAYHLTSGLLSGFVSLRPLLTEVIVGIDHGAAAFDRWTQSTGGITKFMTYTQTQLPGVVHTLGELVTTVSHLVQGLAPLGTASLSTIGVLAQVINSIPVGVLQSVIPLIVGLSLGLKALNLADSAAAGIGKLATRLESLGAVGGKASGALTTAGKAVSFLGPIGLAAGLGLGLLTDIMGSNSAAAQKAAQDTNDYTQALIASNGAIDDTIAKTAAKQLQDAGAFDTAKKLNIGQAELTQTVLQGGIGLQQLEQHLQGVITAGTHYTTSGRTVSGGMDAQAKAARSLLDILDEQGSSFAAAVAAQKNLTDATTADNQALIAQNPALGRQAEALGITASALLAAQTAQDKQKASTDAATLAMQLQNNAAGLLQQALDGLNKGHLSLAQAQTALDSATLQANKTLLANKGIVTDNTDAGVADQQAINGQVAALQAKASADAQVTQSSKKATDAYNANAQALLDNIGRTYGAKSAVYAYYQNLLQIGKFKVPPTKFDIDDSQALAAIAAVRLAATNLGAEISAAGGQLTLRGLQPRGAATGGLIRGPGSGTSDSIPTFLSNGEFVMPAGVTSRYLPLLESLRSGSGVQGPGVGSPAAQAVHASYSTPAARPAPTVAHNSTPTVVHFTSYTVLDGRVLTTTVDEYHLQDSR